MDNKIIDNAFLASLEAVVLNLKQNLRGFFGGIHKTNTTGSSVEFSDFREYVLGDDLRKIDWNLYSRFEKHFIKLFIDERQMHNTIYIDTSASMGRLISEKNRACLQAVAALGFLSVQCLDKLSYKLINGNTVTPMGGLVVGKDAFYESINNLEKVKFANSSSLSEAICREDNVSSGDGAAIIVSDFLFHDDYKKGIDYLLYQNKDVMVIHVLSAEELQPNLSGRYRLIDSEMYDDLGERKSMNMKITKSSYQAYMMALKDYLDDIRQYCVSRGVGYALITTDKPIVNQLFESLYENVGTK